MQGKIQYDPVFLLQFRIMLVNSDKNIRTLTSIRDIEDHINGKGNGISTNKNDNNFQMCSPMDFYNPLLINKK